MKDAERASRAFFVIHSRSTVSGFIFMETTDIISHVLIHIIGNLLNFVSSINLLC